MYGFATSVFVTTGETTKCDLTGADALLSPPFGFVVTVFFSIAGDATSDTTRSADATETADDVVGVVVRGITFIGAFFSGTGGLTGVCNSVTSCSTTLRGFV